MTWFVYEEGRKEYNIGVFTLDFVNMADTEKIYRIAKRILDRKGIVPRKF